MDQGRDLEQLRQKLGTTAKDSFKSLPKGGFEKKNVTRWDFGPLPNQMDLLVGDTTVNGFPALKDCGASVSLVLVDDPVAAEEIMGRGLVRLFGLQMAQQVRHLKSSLEITRQTALAWSGFGKKEQLVGNIIDLALYRVFTPPGKAAIRDEASFKTRLQAGRGKLVREAEKVADLAARVLGEYHEVRMQMRSATKYPAMKPILPQVQEQLELLLNADFLWLTPSPWLEYLPRFLKGARLRLERRVQNPKKDEQKAALLAPLWQGYMATAQKQAKDGINDPELKKYFWMLEEFRVSLFAQELKTSIPVSNKRLTEQWQKVLK